MESHHLPTRSKDLTPLLRLLAHVQSKESVSADALSLPTFTHLRSVVSEPNEKWATGQATRVLHTYLPL